MKVPSTINGKLWAPARVRGNQRPMAPLFPSMTSLQHFTILFLSINLFKHSTKSQNGRKQHQQTNTFTSHWCFVWYFWYSWWGHGGALVFFAFVLKVTHFPPPPFAAAPNSSGRSKRPVRGPAMMAPTKAPTPPTALGLAGRGKRECTRQVRWTYCFATREKFINVPATEKHLSNHVEKALSIPRLIKTW